MKNEKAYFWPELFYESLATGYPKISAPVIKQLNRANLYIWRALNIYDDFLDGRGEAIKLPLANRYYRQFLEIYYTLHLGNNFYKIFRFILKDLDQANRQEILNRQLIIKDNKITWPQPLPGKFNLLDLARKSLALALGPIAIISHWPDKSKKSKLKLTINLFRHLLAIKQLADDAQDWLDDLKAGQITAANLPILKEAKKQKLILDFKNRPDLIYLLFAKKAAPEISAGLNKLIKETEALARSLNLKPNNRFLAEILGPIKTGLVETKRFRDRLSPSVLKMI